MYHIRPNDLNTIYAVFKCFIRCRAGRLRHHTMTSQAVGSSRTARGESIDGERDVDITDRTGDHEGFSLVEVLIAVIVLSFGLLAVGGLAWLRTRRR